MVPLHNFVGLAAVLAVPVTWLAGVPTRIAFNRPNRRRMVAALLAPLLLAFAACTAPESGTLELTIVDTSHGRLTPARVELLSDNGSSVVPQDALAVFADCGGVPVHTWEPSAARQLVLENQHRGVSNPYTGTKQFYIDGSITAALLPGRYRITVTKGIEYRVAHADVSVAHGQTQRLELQLERWIDLPRQGWFSADDHLHIPRADPRFDPLIAAWMEAEDIHVGNFLQMGRSGDVHVTPQGAFGSSSVYREGGTLLVSGQENPRTHVLGHSITLGARQWINFPRSYLLYDRFWQEARDQGAVSGYAHWGLGPAEEGMAVWGHRELLDFVEVLNLGLPFYDRWYELLNLGSRIGPTAGTDYPCLPGLPGRERFYARLDGPLELDAWLEAVRRGKTFVTNGPVIELTVEDAPIGEDVYLSGPGSVKVAGSVRFDPERDDLRLLELIQAGKVVRRIEPGTTPGRIQIEASVNLAQSTWLALRASGEKRGETEWQPRDRWRGFFSAKRRSNEELTRVIPEGVRPRPSAAHTGAVWVTVEGTPPIAEQPDARRVSETWLGRLDELQDRFRDDQLPEMVFRGPDGVDEVELRANRQALLHAITASRAHHASATER